MIYVPETSTDSTRNSEAVVENRRKTSGWRKNQETGSRRGRLSRHRSNLKLEIASHTAHVLLSRSDYVLNTSVSDYDHFSSTSSTEIGGMDESTQHLACCFRFPFWSKTRKFLKQHTLLGTQKWEAGNSLHIFNFRCSVYKIKSKWELISRTLLGAQKFETREVCQIIFLYFRSSILVMYAKVKQELGE